MTDNSSQPGYGVQPPNPPQTPWAPPPPPPPTPERHHHGGVKAGIILIAIGVVFLAGEVVPGVAWWNLWPLLVVLAGVVQAFTRDHHDRWTVYRIFEGIGTVLVGVVLLGNTLGVVSWSVWWVFITLWPALLIALGISILGRGLHQMWLRGAGTVLVWATLAYAVAMSLTGVGGLAPIQPWTHDVAGQAYDFSEPVADATSGSLELNGGAGRVRIHSGDALIHATGTTPFGAPEFAVKRDGAKADVGVTLGASDRTIVAPGFTGGDADIELSPSVQWDAVIKTGASQLNADLTDLKIAHLTLKAGVSDTALKLGEVPAEVSSTDVVIKTGLSNVAIEVPADAAVRIDTHDGLTNTAFGSSFIAKSAGVWETPGASDAARVINISIESGISSVSVRTY